MVPSFNAAATIERTLRSLVLQNYPELELICMDGASSDGTQAVVERYADHVAVFRSEKDSCQAEALNKGLRLATGDVVGWLCADDELAPGALPLVGHFFLKHPQIDVITGGCRRVFDDGSSYDTTPGQDFMRLLFLKNTLEQPSTFWRRHVQEAVGPLSEELKYAFDWEYWCRMKSLGVSFSAVDDVLSVYHFSDSNLTSTGGRAIADEMYQIVRRYGPYGGRLAWAYRLLYRAFDLQGFYDSDADKHGAGKYLFNGTLRLLYWLYDSESINSYNWNFASRQERGLGW